MFLPGAQGSELYTQTSISPPWLCVARAPEGGVVVEDSAGEGGGVVGDATAVLLERDAIVGV